MKGFLILCVMLVAWPAFADVYPAATNIANGAQQVKLCDAESDVGPCQNSANTQTIVVDAGGRTMLTLYATQSTATTFTCDAYGNDTGYHATARTALTSSGAGTQLTPTTMVVSVGGAFRFVWIECSTAISGGGSAVTVTATIAGGR